MLDAFVVAVILIVVGFFALRTEKGILVDAKIPDTISAKLLFTPYVPTKLPKGFEIDKSSYTMQETALIFTASSKSGGRLVFSEQSVPKDMNMDEFYGNNVSNPQRLDGLKYRTIFGALQGRNSTIASIVTEDGTWILATMPKDATKETATTISQSLVKQ